MVCTSWTQGSQLFFCCLARFSFEIFGFGGRQRRLAWSLATTSHAEVNRCKQFDSGPSSGELLLFVSTFIVLLIYLFKHDVYIYILCCYIFIMHTYIDHSLPLEGLRTPPHTLLGVSDWSFKSAWCSSVKLIESTVFTDSHPTRLPGRTRRSAPGERKALSSPKRSRTFWLCGQDSRWSRFSSKMLKNEEHGNLRDNGLMT